MWGGGGDDYGRAGGWPVVSHFFWRSSTMRHANTVSTIFCFTSTMSSGSAYTSAPFLRAIETAYFAFASFSYTVHTHNGMGNTLEWLVTCTR